MHCHRDPLRLQESGRTELESDRYGSVECCHFPTRPKMNVNQSTCEFGQVAMSDNVVSNSW